MRTRFILLLAVGILALGGTVVAQETTGSIVGTVVNDVGTPIAGRNHTELEDPIGFFVNTLVLRTDLSENPTFRELLGRVRQVSLSAYDHQDLPFEKLVEELQPERHMNRSPLVQVLFQLLDFSDKDLSLRDVEVSRLPSSTGRVRFDLEMHLWRQPQSLHGSVVYATDLFDAGACRH